MATPPLTCLSYSNLAVALMGHALERIAGLDYETYVTERITQPLDMTDTFFHPSQKVQNRVAIPYTKTAGTVSKQKLIYSSLGGLQPAGGLFSTVTDLGRFISLHKNCAIDWRHPEQFGFVVLSLFCDMRVGIYQAGQHS